MRTIPITDIREIATHFALDGSFVSADRYGRGHINNTFVVNVERKSKAARYIFQRINEHVFRDPVALMDNIRRVTEHLDAKSVDARSHLSLVPNIDGGHCYLDENNRYWRAYLFIEGARAYDTVASTAQAREAAAIFGRFQRLISDLSAPRLHETIADFHNTPARYRHFHKVLRRDSHDRAGHCMAEIDCTLAYEKAAAVLVALQDAGNVPERIAHNDTKLNNVMFDAQTGKALCVIDLDTVMPGLVLYDFGDLVRTATTSAAEDETDLSRVTMRMEYFEALVEGYLSTALAFLTESEIEYLYIAGKVIAIETGVRFLSDYLSGDEYFRVHRPDQNLDRCRAQLALVASIDAQLDEMQRVVASVASKLKATQQAS